jgi:hypothetical protein
MLLPVMVQSLTFTVTPPTLDKAASDPEAFVIVSPEMLTAPPLIRNMPKSGVPLAVLRCTAKSRAPGPMIVTSLVIESLSLVSVITPEMEKIDRISATGRVVIRDRLAQSAGAGVSGFRDRDGGRVRAGDTKQCFAGNAQSEEECYLHKAF